MLIVGPPFAAPRKVKRDRQGGGGSVDKFDFDQMTTWFFGDDFFVGSRRCAHSLLYVATEQNSL